MTQLDKDIKILDPCPPQEFLQAWATGMLKDRSLQSVIFSHLEFCPSCHQKVREFKRTRSPDDDPIAKRAQALRERQLAQQKAVKQGPTPGTIWRTVPESEKDQFGPLVLIIDRQEAKEGVTLTLAEVSEDIAQAIHTDMVLEPKESGLRFRCMVRSENTFTTSPDRLTFFAGAFSSSLMNRVTGFCREAERFDENIPLSKFVFLKDSQGTELMRRRGVTSGMLVTEENDSRLQFLELSRERCSYLTGESAIEGSSWSLARKLLVLVKRVTASILPSTKKRAPALGESEDLKDRIAKIEAENAELKNKAHELVALKDKVTQQLAEAWEALKNPTGELKLAPACYDCLDLPEPLDPKEGKEILQAAQSGDLVVLRKLVKDWIAADFPDEKTWTSPLHLAALNGHLAVTEFLLDKGARVDAQDKDGKTALMMAAERGHRDQVELLLERKADPKLCDKGGRTALYWALENGHEEIAKTLRSQLGLWY